MQGSQFRARHEIHAAGELIIPLSRIVFDLNSDGISFVSKIMLKSGDVTQLWLDFVTPHVHSGPALPYSSYFLPLARIFQPQPPCILHEPERAVAKIPAQKQRRTTRRTDGRLSLIRGTAAASSPCRPTIYQPLACWLVHSNEGEGWDKVW